MNHTTESQVDNLIDATLATLRNTPAPTGLEDRLLSTLASAQQRISTPKQTRMWVPHVSLLRHGWTTNFVLPRLWIPSALAAAAVLAITFAIHVHHPSTPTQTSTTAAVDAPSTASTPHELVILSHRRRTCCSGSHHLPIEATTRNTAPTPYEQAALEDTLAPSQPAPPLPLTQQERLLLRILHQGSYTELAELNPAVRSTLDAQQTAAFQKFFTPPTPATSKSPATTGDKQ
jgi:hypothetical protein